MQFSLITCKMGTRKAADEGVSKSTLFEHLWLFDSLVVNTDGVLVCQKVSGNVVVMLLALMFVIARSGATWQSRAGTFNSGACHPATCACGRGDSFSHACGVPAPSEREPRRCRAGRALDERPYGIY